MIHNDTIDIDISEHFINYPSHVLVSSTAVELINTKTAAVLGKVRIKSLYDHFRKKT